MLANPGGVVLAVWKEKGVLLDGHNRYAICQKHNLRYDFHLISLPDLDGAKLWIINEQHGRRNLTDEQRSYYRGTQYDLEKKRHGGQLRGSGQNGPSKTRKHVAQQHQVGKRTIERDSRFTRAVDTIAGDGARKVKITRQEMQ